MMIFWSSLLRSPCIIAPNSKYRLWSKFLSTPKNLFNHQQYRTKSDCEPFSHMIIRPSRFQWDKFKDLLHFYTFFGLLPILGIVFYADVFVGPSQLEEIPEGYEPKHWEYHRHPISRFLARYVYPSPQQEYEKALHYLYEQAEKKKLFELEKKVRDKMSERSDYQAYFYRPAIAKYHRISKEAADALDPTTH